MRINCTFTQDNVIIDLSTKEIQMKILQNRLEFATSRVKELEKLLSEGLSETYIQNELRLLNEFIDEQENKITLEETK